ncbi:hypothetical protein S40288_10578 [Stachybotrys chartarum IBT 40288]|nr:hypothetical protein S40288_10578 [Stachybotrys chartarum IBT 40288]
MPLGEGRHTLLASWKILSSAIDDPLVVVIRAWPRPATRRAHSCPVACARPTRRVNKRDVANIALSAVGPCWLSTTPSFAKAGRREPRTPERVPLSKAASEGLRYAIFSRSTMAEGSI